MVRAPSSGGRGRKFESSLPAQLKNLLNKLLSRLCRNNNYPIIMEIMTFPSVKEKGVGYLYNTSNWKELKVGGSYS